MSDRPLATLLVTAHDAAGGIARTLRALSRQEGFAAGALEIVLVDDRSSDETSALAAGLGLTNLRIVRVERHDATGRTARQRAIEIGVEAARGDVVVVTDCDAEPPAGWARALVGAIERCGIDLAGGSVRFEPRDRGSRVLAWLQTADAAYYLTVCAVLSSAGLASGVLFGSAAFRRATFLSLGGFSATGLRLTEDLAFARIVRRAGRRVGFVPRPAVPVASCGSLRELVTRAIRTSEGGASALAAVLGGWMALLPLLLIAGAVGAPWGWSALLARWVAGVVFTAVSLVRVGVPGLLPVAPIYEIAAVTVAALVAVRRARAREVEWGGIRYPLRRGPERAGV